MPSSRKQKPIYRRDHQPIQYVDEDGQIRHGVTEVVPVRQAECKDHCVSFKTIEHWVFELDKLAEEVSRSRNQILNELITQFIREFGKTDLCDRKPLSKDRFITRLVVLPNRKKGYAHVNERGLNWSKRILTEEYSLVKSLYMKRSLWLDAKHWCLLNNFTMSELCRFVLVEFFEPAGEAVLLLDG